MPAKPNPLSSAQLFVPSPAAAGDKLGGYRTCSGNDGDPVIEIPCEEMNENSDVSTTTIAMETIGEQPVAVGITEGSDTTTLTIFFCGHSLTCEIPTHLYKIFVPTPDDVIRLVGNFFRDGPWALIAAAGWMINFSVIPSSLDTDAAFWEATKAQWLWSSVTAGLSMAALFPALKKYEYEADGKKTIASFMALSLAIVSWNWGQFKCARDFLNEEGLRYEKAGYAASVCTGALEGPAVQFAFYSLLLLAFGENNPQDSMRERYWRYFNNGACGALHFALYLLVNLLINPIAGGNWQLAYNALFPYCNSNATNTSASACAVEPTPSNLTAVFFAVAFTVLVSNYLVSATSIAFDSFLNKWLPLKKSEDAASPAADVDAADSVAGAVVPVTARR